MAIEIVEKVSSKFDAKKIIYELNQRQYLIETHNDVYTCNLHELHKYIKNDRNKKKDNISFNELCDGVWVTSDYKSIWKRIFNPDLGYEIRQIFYSDVVNLPKINFKNENIEINNDKLYIKLPVFKTWALIEKKNNKHLFMKKAFFEYNNKFYYIPFGNQKNFNFCIYNDDIRFNATDKAIFHNLFQTFYSNHGYINLNGIFQTTSDTIIITSDIIDNIQSSSKFIKYFEENIHNVSKFEILYYISLKIQQYDVNNVIKCLLTLKHIHNPFIK